MSIKKGELNDLDTSTAAITPRGAKKKISGVVTDRWSMRWNRFIATGERRVKENTEKMRRELRDEDLLPEIPQTIERGLGSNR